MRINKFVAQASGLSRRAADEIIAAGHVTLNDAPARLGDIVTETDTVHLNGRPLELAVTTTIMLNKPAGYIVSRSGQGGQTVYDLLPAALHKLKPVGRLDKDSSGLLLLTSDGDLAQSLTHPSSHKRKVYQVTLRSNLQPLHRQMISEHGLTLPDGLSKFSLERVHDGDERIWIVTMYEGRNRQIRRTFESLGYKVGQLHRSQFGNYQLGQLRSGSYAEV